jgi:hypothetical protein
MPPNNRNRSPRQRMPTDLEGRYGKIGISAVEAGVFERPKENAPLDQGCWRERSQQRTTEATEGLILNPGPPDSRSLSRTVRLFHPATEVRHYDAPERDVRAWMSDADNSGSIDRADRDWIRPDAVQKSSRMGNGRQVRNAGTGS